MSGCMVCGEHRSGHGFRPPGPRSLLPERLRDKYLWTCARTECRREGMMRALAAVGISGGEADKIVDNQRAGYNIRIHKGAMAAPGDGGKDEG